MCHQATRVLGLFSSFAVLPAISGCGSTAHLSYTPRNLPPAYERKEAFFEDPRDRPCRYAIESGRLVALVDCVPMGGVIYEPYPRAECFWRCLIECTTDTPPDGRIVVSEAPPTTCTYTICHLQVTPLGLGRSRLRIEADNPQKGRIFLEIQGVAEKDLKNLQENATGKWQQIREATAKGIGGQTTQQCAQ